LNYHFLVGPLGDLPIDLSAHVGEAAQHLQRLADDRAARNSGGVTALTEEMIWTCDGEKR
jgi:hypothetical protein